VANEVFADEPAMPAPPATPSRADIFAVIQRSGLFDAAYYRHTNPHLTGTENELLEHYLDVGCPENLRPNPYFDACWYLDAYPDLAQGGMLPLVHYIMHGDSENRQPSPMFNTLWYRATHGLSLNESALAHYLSRRCEGTVSPLPEFSVAYYAKQSPDVIASKIDPFEHFVSYGFREGRNPAPDFDVKWYADNYLSGSMAENPFYHWLAHRGQPGVHGRLTDNEPTAANKADLQSRGLAEKNGTFAGEALYEPGIGLRGAIDAVNHSEIRGWAQDTAHPEKPLYLELYIDGTRTAGTYANCYRDDLRQAGLGSGYHAFVFQSPLAMLDGTSHTIKISPANSDVAVPPGEMQFSLSIPLPLRYFTEVREILSATARKIIELEKLLAPEVGDQLIKRTETEGNYQAWFVRYTQLDHASKAALLARSLRFNWHPKFSVIMPTYNTPPTMLKAAIASVKAQLYQNWELCIADDASTSKATLDILAEAARSDDRIRVVYRTENGHISEATNSALEIATGDYLCLFDHDDLISEDALYHFARVLNTKRFDIIYSDEDKVDKFGRHHDPHFKPDFNYTLLLSYNYICHFLCVSRVLADRVGGFRTETNGSQDHDFILRCLEKTSPDKLNHIPLILYHWRVHAGSTAASIGTKSYAISAGEIAIQSHLDRVGIAATVVASPVFGYNVAWPIPADPPLVSVVVPTRDHADVLALCLSGLLNRTNYKNIEVIVVDNGSTEQETFDLFAVAERSGKVRILRHNAPFNYSEICNLGAREARGSLLLMLNNDIEVLDSDWLHKLVSQVLRPGIGAAGAKLLYPDRRVQHAGVILGVGGVAGHAHKLLGQDEPGYMARAIVTHELSACTGACLLIDRSVFDDVGGFNETELSVAFNDIDLCLKIREQGHGIVFAADVVLIHHESLSRGLEDVPSKILRAHSEVAYMRARWATLLDCDPFYSPNLTLVHEDFRIDVGRGAFYTV
jgi:GT2 family glycosyltransferase